MEVVRASLDRVRPVLKDDVINSSSLVRCVWIVLPLACIYPTGELANLANNPIRCISLTLSFSCSLTCFHSLSLSSYSPLTPTDPAGAAAVRSPQVPRPLSHPPAQQVWLLTPRLSVQHTRVCAARSITVPRWFVHGW